MLISGDWGHCPSHLAIFEAKWAEGKVVTETTGPLRLEWFPVPVRKSCICHTHQQMTLLRVCLVQELGDIQDSHTLQCPQGHELFPECSSVFHVGGVFQCICLEVTPSVWVCLTSQRSNAMGRAVKYFPNKHWLKPPEGEMIHPKEVTPALKYIAICSKENFKLPDPSVAHI